MRARRRRGSPRPTRRQLQHDGVVVPGGARIRSTGLEPSRRLVLRRTPVLRSPPANRAGRRSDGAAAHQSRRPAGTPDGQRPGATHVHPRSPGTGDDRSPDRRSEHETDGARSTAQVVLDPPANGHVLRPRRRAHADDHDEERQRGPPTSSDRRGECHGQRHTEAATRPADALTSIGLIVTGSKTARTAMSAATQRGEPSGQTRAGPRAQKEPCQGREVPVGARDLLDQGWQPQHDTDRCAAPAATGARAGVVGDPACAGVGTARRRLRRRIRSAITSAGQEADVSLDREGRDEDEPRRAHQSRHATDHARSNTSANGRTVTLGFQTSKRDRAQSPQVERQVRSAVQHDQRTSATP